MATRQNDSKLSYEITLKALLMTYFPEENK